MHATVRKGYPEYDPDQPRSDDGTWAATESPGDPRKLKPPAERDYLYHGTNADGFEAIRESGRLRTFGPSHGTDQDAWPDGTTERRSYWSDKPSTVEYFYPEEGAPVLLRAKRANHKFRVEGTGDFYVRSAVPAGDLEYLGSDGSWHTLKVAKGYPEFDPSQPRNEDGTWGSTGRMGSWKTKEGVEARFPGAAVDYEPNPHQKGSFTVTVRNQDEAHDLHLRVSYYPGSGSGEGQVNLGLITTADTRVGRETARRALAFVLDMAEESGARSIFLSAGLESGGYVWPRIGFDSYSAWDSQEDYVKRLDEAKAAGLSQALYDKGMAVVNNTEPMREMPSAVAQLDDPVPLDVFETAVGFIRTAAGVKPTLGKLILLAQGGSFSLPREKYSLLRDWLSRPFSKRMRKGYPEYDRDQPRNEDGRWSGGETRAAVARTVARSGSDKLDHRKVTINDLRSALTERTWALGVNVTVRGSYPNAYQVRFEAAGAGSTYGIFSVTEDGKTIDAGYLEVPNDPSGRRVATTIMRVLRDFAVASGVEQIRTSAGLDMGGYVWPRRGFNLVMDGVADALNEGVRRRVKALFDRNLITQAEFADIDHTLTYEWADGTGPTTLSKLDRPMNLNNAQLYSVSNTGLRGRQTLGKVLLAGTRGNYTLPRAKFDVLGFNKMAKGYPEYDPDQLRDEGGRFASGGGTPLSRSNLVGAGHGVPAIYDDVSGDLNSALRAGLSGALGRRRYKNLIGRIDAAIAAWKTKADAVVWRMVPSEIVGKLRVGDVIEDRAFVSVSSRRLESTAERQTPRPAIMEIHVPAGAQIAPVAERSSDEFLLPRGTRFRYDGHGRFVVLSGALVKGYPEYNQSQSRGEDGRWSAGAALALSDGDALSRSIQRRFSGVGVAIGPYTAGFDVAVGDDNNVATFFVSRLKGPLTFEQIKTVDTPEGRNFARMALQLVLDAAKASGAPLIRLRAAGAGGYVWPAVGFELSTPAELFVQSNNLAERVDTAKKYLSWSAGWMLDRLVRRGGANLPRKLAALNTPLTYEQMADISGSNPYIKRVSRATLGKALLVGTQGDYVLRASNYDRLQRYVNRTVKRAANVVTFEQALKGYPEYRADQPRGEGGRWSGGGGATPAIDDRAGALLRRNMERDPGFTADEFIKQLPKDQQDFIARSERKLARGAPTEAPVSKGGFRTEDGKHWIPSRQRVHEKIIRDMIGEAVERGAYPKDGEAPTIILMGGRGGAGKTTVVKTQLGIDPENDDRFLYLNSDDIKAKLPGFEGWNAGLLHEESSHVSDQIERIARELGLNIIYDATLKSEGSAVQRINESEAAGYNIEGVFVHTTPYTSATRAMARAVKSGRYVPPSYILGSTSNERTFDAVKGRMHKWVLFDNNGNFSPKKIASGGKRRRK